MNIQMQARLEKVIENWISKETSTNEFQNLDFWFPNGVAAKMANAAAIVFDATVDASKFAEETEKANK